MISRLMRRRARRKLAVSTIVANLLMIAVTLSLAAILVAWAGTSFGSLTSGSQLFFAQRGQALQERFVIENVFFNETGPSSLQMMIFVRNVGAEQVSVVAIYASTNDIDNSLDATALCSGGSLPQTLVVGQVCEFSATWPASYATGTNSIFQIIATTARGNRATFTVRGP